MILSLAIFFLYSTALVIAQERPNTTAPCDYYAEKTVGSNTAENQRTLMALVLHSALLGPFSKYNTIPVPDFTGALTATTFHGEAVNLNGYFNGGFASANTGNDEGVAVNFLGAGGLDAARNLEPSNGDTNSPQHIFFTHVYSYFGTFLGCSHIGSSELPTYSGNASMYEVHKFMDLNQAEMGFFVQQAILGLLSVGFTDADAQFVNTTLDTVFNHRCAPGAPIIPADQGPQLQAICVAADCALAVNDTCSAYGPAIAPMVANSSLIGNYTKNRNGTTYNNASRTSTGGTTGPITTTGSNSAAAFAHTGLEYGVAFACTIFIASMLG